MMVGRVYLTNWIFPPTPEGDPFTSFGLPQPPYNGAKWQLNIEQTSRYSRPYTRKSWWSWQLSIRCSSLERAWKVGELLRSVQNVYVGHAQIPYKPEDPKDGVVIRPSEPTKGERELMEVWPGLFDVSSVYGGDKQAVAAILAAQLSRRRVTTVAVHRLACSYDLWSVEQSNFHPEYAPRQYRVTDDPSEYIRFASSIAIAYSAIEELGMQVEPKLLPQGQQLFESDGMPSHAAYRQLQRKGAASSVDVNKSIVWTLRGPRTRIERRFPVVGARRARWAGGVVRDVHLPTYVALSLACRIRSKVAAHSSNQLTSSLTPYDVLNVQALARHLVLSNSPYFRSHTAAEPASVRGQSEIASKRAG